MLGDTEREAWVELHRMLGSASVDSRLTVARLADLWLDDRKRKIQPTTFDSYQRYAQSLVDRWGKVQARDIREHHIDRWINARESWDGCRSLATTIARMIFRFGKRKGYLDNNPLSDMRGEGTKARKPADPGALDKVGDGIRSDEFSDLWAFMRATGVRPGEARSLEADRIDLEAMVAVVKGKRGFRLIVLTSEAAEPLRRAVARHSDGVVFRNTKGEAWSPGALSEQVRRARKRSGAGQVVAYNARGDFATRAHAAGVDPATIAELLGHKDTVRLRILLTHYLNVGEDTLREAVERVAAARAAHVEPRLRPGTPPRKPPGPKPKS